MNVFITGAAGGLGRAMAIECARRGCSLFLTDINADGLIQIKRGLERQFDINVTARPCDLTDSSSVDRLLAVTDQFGIRFDMLLNIAGIDVEGGFLTLEREQAAAIVTLNDAATLRMTHAILHRRRPGRHFSLIFVSSLASMFPMPLKATYAASKRFLLDFATALQRELKDQRVNVLTLCPGGMVTNDGVVEAIAAQGVWGRLTANPLETVARKTIDRALSQSGCYVPGISNRLLAAIGHMVPRSWIAALIYRRWHGAQQKWMTVKPGKSTVSDRTPAFCRVEH